MTTYLTDQQVCELAGGAFTREGLAYLRYSGKGPKFLKPTAKTVLYRESDVIAWLEGSEQTSTAQQSA